VCNHENSSHQARWTWKPVLWVTTIVALMAGIGFGTAEFLAPRAPAKPVIVAGDGVRGPKGMMWVPGGEFLMGSDHKLARKIRCRTSAFGW